MITKQIKQLIKLRKEINPNDYSKINELWAKEIEVLTFSLSDTIQFLESASIDEILWTTEIWEDLYNHFQSNDLINTFNQLADKYQNYSKEIKTSIDAFYCEK